MIARIGLIVAGILVWAGIAVALLQMSAAPAGERIAASARAELAANHSRLALAAEQTLASRLPEVETLAGVLGLGKSLEPTEGKKKNAAKDAKEGANAMATRTQAAIGALPGAPLYAIVGANGVVVAATLWPEDTVVRAEPAVQSALGGVSRLSVWRKDGQPFMLAASPALGSDGSPVGALVVARPLGKELCDEIAQASGLKVFAISVADKITCTGGAEASVLAALKPGTQAVVAQALPEPPLFVNAAEIGMAVDARGFRPELPSSSIIAGTDMRPGFSALHDEQVRSALVHLALLAPIALFMILFGIILGQSAGRMANHLSRVLQQGDKAGMLDEHHYTGRMRRLAKNVNGLLLRSPIKAPNEKISLMLGTVDEPPDDGHDMPLSPPGKSTANAATGTVAKAFDGPISKTVETAPPAAMGGTAAAALASVPVAKPQANAQPNPLASPFDSNELANAFDSSFDGDFDPTRIAGAPKAPEASRPGSASYGNSSNASASFSGLGSLGLGGDSLLKSKSLGDSHSLASEEFRFGDSAPPALPDLPAAQPPPVARPATKTAGEISDLEADAALGSLPSWSPEMPAAAAAPAVSTLPALPAEPAAAAPAGPSPWDAGPGIGAAIDASAPDAAHFQETYDQFVRTRAQCGEPGDLPLAKFVDKLKKSREQVMQRQNCQKVRFQVYVKDGKAALKAVAFR